MTGAPSRNSLIVRVRQLERERDAALAKAARLERHLEGLLAVPAADGRPGVATARRRETFSQEVIP